MGYSVKILTNEDFDRLPYEFAQQAFAVTSPDKKDIYVRHTNIHDFNKMLVGHELDHLVEEFPTDEGPAGERYFLGDLLSSLWGGIKNIGSGIRNSFSGGGSQDQGFTTNFLSRQALASQNMMNFGTPNVTPRIAPSFGAGFKSGFGNQSLGSKAGSGIGSILSSFLNPSTLLGAGSLFMGLGKKLPDAPQLPPSVNQLRSQVESGGSPLGQQAQGVISQNLSQQFNPLTDAELTAATADLDRSRLQDIKRLEDLYASTRPGTDYTTDTTYKRDLGEIERSYAQSKADTVANRTRQAQEIFNQNQYRNVQSAIGASDTQMKQLYDIAQLDIYQIAQQLQIDLAQAQQFKETFTSIGSDLLRSGLGVPTMSLFG